MAGWKEYAHEIRKRDTHYVNATGNHVAVYALDNNRVYIIDENGSLVDFQIKDGFFNDVQISGNCQIIGQQIVTDTVIDGYDLIFSFNSEDITGNMANANPSGADWRMDTYSISGVSNGFNQLRIFDNADGKTYISVRKDGSVIIGENADLVNDDGVHTLQISGSMVVYGWITSPRGSGSYNEAIGKNSLVSTTTGGYNTTVGSNSQNRLTTGNYNTSIGSGALYSNISGSGNVAIGYNAGYNETESNTLYVANSAGTSADALIYGKFDTKEVWVNGSIVIRGNVSEDSIQTLSFANTGSTTATSRYLFNMNTSGIASYTVTLPSSPKNGQNFTFATRGAITTLTINGGSSNSLPTSMSTNDRVSWVFSSTDSLWMRVV